MQNLAQLQNKLRGDLRTDLSSRSIYATDASIYREIPLAVAFPKDASDLIELVRFARDNKTSLIPRAAGTSLAGQCVGDGIVVDTSRYMTRILEFNKDERWVLVEPGVIRDELNAFLEPHGLFFGPNTSTANRCMMGGMVGNNSSGTTSIKYGVTRDHVLELHTILSDGSAAVFNADPNRLVPENPFQQRIMDQMLELLDEEGARDEIKEGYPHPGIHRRNTGYALDILAEQTGFPDLTKLLTGSEGTLALTTGIKLGLSPLPPHNMKLVCAHFESISECMQGVLVAMREEPYACELMDKIVLDCTRENIGQQENRFFIEGDPVAVLITELRNDDPEDLDNQVQHLVGAFKAEGLGYAFPVVDRERASRVWGLRAAGLGLLSNIPGNAKPIACIEDTAVDLKDLPAYIDEFEGMMKSFGQRAVYYAHAGAGELHLRPILDLKSPEERKQFRRICEASAHLVQKYNGSLSGEHGDGRVRAEFIPLIIGEKNYRRLIRTKNIWDPDNLFNPGKIVGAKPLDTDLRYTEGQKPVEVDTRFNTNLPGGILEAAEKCNGSADCRKLTGLMCPSYQASGDESDTTRARANLLREVITNSKEEKFKLANEDLIQILDLCLSCKGCKRECPSNVDMALMKAEVKHQYHQKNGVPLRTRAFANIHRINRLGSAFPVLSNALLDQPVFSSLLKKVLGVASERSLPLLNRKDPVTELSGSSSSVDDCDLVLYIDEFSRYNDTGLARKTFELLSRLGFKVHILSSPSGRTYFSQGMLDHALSTTENTLEKFRTVIEKEKPVVGIEPSAILTFRDEYPGIVRGDMKAPAVGLAALALTFEEFIHDAFQEGQVTSKAFHREEKSLLLHVHCYQKSLSKPEYTSAILSIPDNYQVEMVKSGCCGMAGSFGYEKNKYVMSMKIGSKALFPAIEKNGDKIIVAAGTSCRHQILDGTERKALHPAEVLWAALA